MRKRLLSLALALALSLGLFTVPASAAGATVIEIVPADTYDQFLTDGSGNYWSSGGVSNVTEGIISCGSRFSGYGAIDATGKVILPPGTAGGEITFHNGVAWIFKNGYWIAVDTSGSELFRLKPEDIGARSVEVFYDGMARVSNREGMSGYLDMTGKLVIPMEYNTSSNFHDGMAKVYDAANAFWGYIDKTGKLVIPYQYDYVADFSYGFAKVRLGDTWSFIDKTGKTVNLPEGYSPQVSAWVSPEVLLAVTGTPTSVSHTYAFFNKSGQMISGPYSGCKEDSEGMFIVKKGDSYVDIKYGCVNEAGIEVIPCTMDFVGEYRDGFTVGRSGAYPAVAFSIFDKTGKVTGTWTGKDYDSLSNIGNGCFKIVDEESSSTTRYGFIDYTGREIVPCKYKGIGDFFHGMAQVWNFSNDYGFVNTEGQEIVPCVPSKFTSIIYRGDGVYQVQGYHDDGRWSVIRGSGWTEPSVSSAPSTPAQPSGPSANPTNAKVLVNGEEVAFDAYTIDGSNYFKLRDLAFVLNGTEKQFEVGWEIGRAHV